MDLESVNWFLCIWLFGKTQEKSHHLGNQVVLKLVIYLFIYLLGWHWLTKPYKFQAYNSTKHHLPTASCTHHPKSFCPHFSPFAHLNLPPSPFPLANATLLSVLCYVYIFFDQSLHLLWSSSPSPSPLTAGSLFHVSMSQFLFISLFCSLDS